MYNQETMPSAVAVRPGDILRFITLAMSSLQSIQESTVKLLIVRLGMFFAFVVPEDSSTWAVPSVDFAKDVAPILQQHCVRCHKTSDPNGDLDLTHTNTVVGGIDDAAVVVPGQPQESYLLEMISGDEPEMPKESPPLTTEQVATIRSWIEAGAPWPDGIVLTDESLADTDWWSLQPIQKLLLPKLDETDSSWVRTPIDAFVLAKLREQGLSPSRKADRRTLILRLYFDLVGLPPDPEEIESFVNDPNKNAYEKLVDELLASQRYGERWARHWLDVVHYADTHGFDKDKVRNHAWPYRDYVIRSLNDDKPYDRFVREQLAGDVFYPDEDDGIVALGFIAAGPFDWVGHIEVAEGSMEKKRVRNLDRDDMVRNTIETFCSSTIGCARCHDHKFDPFTSKDYYALQAVFAAVDRADRPYDLDPEVEKLRSTLLAEQARLTAQIAGEENGQHEQQAALEKSLEEVETKLTSLPEQQLVFAAATSFVASGQFQSTNGNPRPVHLLMRGNESNPLQLSEPGAIRCLSQLNTHFDSLTDQTEGAYRAALAEWILDEQNPLTWRSIVNRIWQYHFGRGLVDTPNDFGRMGSEPTHPELLDWLAATFRDGDRSLKNLHRLIVNSATYRQSSVNSEANSQIDRNNRYLWRMNRQRLDAESVRDAMLMVSGKLDLTMYGPGFQVFGFEDDHSPRYKYQEYDPDDASSHRRSIYRFIVRSFPDPFMETLDCADPSALVAKRNETITPLQSLALMNNQFVVRVAEHFATRIQAVTDMRTEQIELAMQLALGRLPTAQEAERLTAIADKHGLPNACRLIFNMNEFVFID